MLSLIVPNHRNWNRMGSLGGMAKAANLFVYCNLDGAVFEEANVARILRTGRLAR